MNLKTSAVAQTIEQERQQLRDVGFPEEDLDFFLALGHGLPDGDIIHMDITQREGEDDEAFHARYKAALRRGDYLCPDAPRLPEREGSVSDWNA